MASIPLPALHVNPPADPSEGMQRILAMKGMMQQQQLQNVQLQQQQMALKQKQALQTLFIKHNGDLDKVIADGPQAGIMPDTLQQLQLHNIDVKTKTADLVSKQGENAVKQADLMQGAHDAVDKAPAEQKAAVYQQQVQQLGKMGVDVSQMPPQYPGDDQFKLVGALVKGHKQLVEDAFKAADTAKDLSQSKEADARTEEVKVNTAKINAEMEFYKKQGLAPGVPLDAQEAADWMRKNPGKSVSDYMKFKTTLGPTTTFNLQNAGATGTPGQPSAMAQALAANEMKWQDAVSPRTPMKVKESLLREVKSINPGYHSGDFTVEQKVKEAFTSGQYSQQLNSINRAREHMGTFLELAKNINNTDSQAVNRVKNAFKTQFGSEAPTDLNIAKQAFASEVGKSFAGANVALADRQELDHQITNASSWEQLHGAAKTADTLLEGAQKALKQTYESGISGKPNFGGDKGGGKVIVTAPDGSKHPFDTQAQADAFKKLANIP